MTIVVSLVVPAHASRSTAMDMRPRAPARTIAPTDPIAPASVGVATPAKIDPSTMRIRSSGGSITTTTRRRSPRQGMSVISGGRAGAASGLAIATPTTYAAYIAASISPGTSPPTKRSPTEIPSWSASTTSTMLGGMICPRVPDARMTPEDSRAEYL